MKRIIAMGVATLALLASAASVSATSTVDGCNVTLEQAGAEFVDITGPAPDDGSQAFALENGRLVLDDTTQVLASGSYIADYDDGTSETFTLTCDDSDIATPPPDPTDEATDEPDVDADQAVATNDKVFVCKYVGTPGEDERLQTGQNPISVSVNAIKDFNGIGSYFNDAQGRSYVLAWDTGQDEPDASECPGSTAPSDTPTGSEPPAATGTPPTVRRLTPPATVTEVQLLADPDTSVGMVLGGLIVLLGAMISVVVLQRRPR